MDLPSHQVTSYAGVGNLRLTAGPEGLLVSRLATRNDPASTVVLWEARLLPVCWCNLPYRRLVTASLPTFIVTRSVLTIDTFYTVTSQLGFTWDLNNSNYTAWLICSEKLGV